MTFPAHSLSPVTAHAQPHDHTKKTLTHTRSKNMFNCFFALLLLLLVAAILANATCLSNPMPAAELSSTQVITMNHSFAVSTGISCDAVAGQTTAMFASYTAPHMGNYFVRADTVKTTIIAVEIRIAAGCNGVALSCNDFLGPGSAGFNQIELQQDVTYVVLVSSAKSISLPSQYVTLEIGYCGSACGSATRTPTTQRPSFGSPTAQPTAPTTFAPFTLVPTASPTTVVPVVLANDVPVSIIIAIIVGVVCLAFLGGWLVRYVRWKIALYKKKQYMKQKQQIYNSKLPSPKRTSTVQMIPIPVVNAVSTSPYAWAVSARKTDLSEASTSNF